MSIQVMNFDEREEMEYSDKDSELSRSVILPVRDPPPVGILRLDKPRRSSAEFQYLSQGEPTSPQPSVDRLSVTFAEDSQRSDISSRCNLYNPNISPIVMDKIQFPHCAEEENSDDEDYSASVSAIMQRRASTRRSKRRTTRRTSSPFSPDILPGPESERRRSSCYTTSSGETAISVEDNLVSDVTQTQIFENIRLHKEVLSSVKMQPWHMRKKIRLVVQAKSYIKRHEGVLQERLAQSHSTKDMLARCNIYLVKRWQHVKREIANLSNWLIPWELRIKEIESHFGSVVASYFTFLRWLFWINLVTSIILIAFVTIPELLTADQRAAGDRKLVLKEDKYNATNFYTLMDFEGILKYSPLFYGWYTNRDVHEKGYRLPLAYFMTGLAVYVYNFVATLRKMAENSRMSKLSEKEDECIFSWKVFTSWDYMIGNAETAANRVASIVMGFKEALLEEAEKKKNTKNWKVIFIRILVNIAVCGLLALSAYVVVVVVKRSTEPEAKKDFWRMNEITIVMNLISLFFPMIFEVLGLVEQYHPRKQLRLQLARIMLLNLLNLYSLNFALFDKITDMQKEWVYFKPNDTSLPIYYNFTNCSKMCDKWNTQELESANLILGPNLYNMTNEFLENQKLNSSEEMLSTMSSSLNFSNEQEYFYDNDTFQRFFEDTFLNDSISVPTLMAAFNFSDNENSLDFSDNFQKLFESLYFGNITEVNATDISTDITASLLTTVYDKYSDISTTSSDNTSYLMYSDSTMELSTTETDILTSFNETIEPFLVSTHESGNDSSSTFNQTTYSFLESTQATIKEANRKNSTLQSTIKTPDEILCPCKPIYFNNSVETYITRLDYQNRSKLRSLCWETMFGQELVKLTVMDLFMTVLSTLAMDFFRGVFVRVMNNCWCWDLEKKFPQYGDFKVAENILHLVNNQGMVWMGMFFSPGIIVINVIKLYILVYFRSWIVLTCNVPHKVVFRASRSNNFYYALLLSMLFLCVIPVGYAIVWIQPSWHCGPFSNYEKIFHIFTKTLREIMPTSVHQILDYIASPGVVIPLLVLMILIIYYLISLTDALREANNDLKIQLRRERTEERRKMFQIADRRRRDGSEGSGELGQTNFGKWKKLLYNLPSGKSFDETPKQESEDVQFQQENKETKPETGKTKDFFSKFLKRALKKSLTSEDEEGTDTDPPDSLPEDAASVKEVKQQIPVKKPFAISKDFNFKHTIHVPLSKKSSLDANQGIHLQDYTAPVAHSSKRRRDSFDLKKHQDKKKFQKSPTKSSTSKDFREDSLTSTWSDNIPVITISKSDSMEQVDDQLALGDKLQEIKERLSTTSSDTLIQKSVDTRVKSRYVLRKQEVTEDENIVNEMTTEKGLQQEKGKEKDIKEDLAANFDTKTESSNDYKDSVFS